jgi:hypothetical protein
MSSFCIRRERWDSAVFTLINKMDAMSLVDLVLRKSTQMFVPHFDFHPHAVIQQGTISIGKNAKGSRKKNLLVFVPPRPCSGKRRRRRVITPFLPHPRLP